MQEEIFGPILCIVPFREREDAIREFRRHLKPLASYIFSKDRAEIDWFLANTTSGSTVVNHNVVQSGTNCYLPFGGVNASGIGRLGGRYSFLECSNARAVVEDGKGLGDPNIMFPPYSASYAKAIAWMLGTKMKTYPAVLRAMNALVRALRKN
jgi:aldehyde dehydrogenase (NAD+)